MNKVPSKIEYTLTNVRHLLHRKMKFKFQSSIYVTQSFTLAMATFHRSPGQGSWLGDTQFLVLALLNAFLQAPASLPLMVQTLKYLSFSSLFPACAFTALLKIYTWHSGQWNMPWAENQDMAPTPIWFLLLQALLHD